MIRYVAPIVILGLLFLPALAAPISSSEPPRLTTSACPDPASLGVVVERVDEAMAAQLGLDAGKGALITRVIRGRSGHKAGLRRHDVITHLGGKLVTARNFASVLKKLKAGTKVELRFIRRLKPMTATATLGSQKTLPKPVAVIVRSREEDRRRRMGCAPRPDALATEITRVRKLERDHRNRSRRYGSKLKSLEKKEAKYSRRQARMEKDVARQRADLERQLARIEASLWKQQKDIDKQRLSLELERRQYAGIVQKSEAERKLLEAQRQKMEAKKKKVDAQNSRKRKKRQIL